MAYRRRTSRTSRASRYARPARSYTRRPARRRTARRGTGSRSANTLKLVIQTTGAPVGMESLPLGMKPAPRPKVARY